MTNLLLNLVLDTLVNIFHINTFFWFDLYQSEIEHKHGTKFLWILNKIWPSSNMHKCRTLQAHISFLRSNHDLWFVAHYSPYLNLQVSYRQHPLNRIILNNKSTWNRNVKLGNYEYNFTKYKFVLTHQLWRLISFYTNRITKIWLYHVVNQTLDYKFRIENFLWFDPYRSTHWLKVLTSSIKTNRPNHTLKEFRHQVFQGTGHLAWWFRRVCCVPRSPIGRWFESSHEQNPLFIPINIGPVKWPLYPSDYP